MEDLLIISTGGTFNKIYNPLNGGLDIDANSQALAEISKLWGCELNIMNIISKDSLEMTNIDRELLLASVLNADKDKIVVIHGTDTMNTSAQYISKYLRDKAVVFTGAMVPYSIEPIGAAVNLSASIGFLLANPDNGVYISMNGLILPHKKISKNRELGCFELIS